MADDPRALVERAIARTRSNALQQLGFAVIGTAVLPLAWGGFTKLVIAFIALNLWIAVIVGRRWLRLRHKGPAVAALLDAPADIKEIASWPRKLPPGRMPVFLDITTTGGAQCSLLLEPKYPKMITDLVGALKARSPEAMLLLPPLPPSG
jgi:hypothetical protein